MRVTLRSSRITRRAMFAAGNERASLARGGVEALDPGFRGDVAPSGVGGGSEDRDISQPSVIGGAQPLDGPATRNVPRASTGRSTVAQTASRIADRAGPARSSDLPKGVYQARDDFGVVGELGKRSHALHIR